MFTFEDVLIFLLLMGITIYKYLRLTWILPQGALTAWGLARVLLDLLDGSRLSLAFSRTTASQELLGLFSYCNVHGSPNTSPKGVRVRAE